MQIEIKRLFKFVLIKYILSIKIWAFSCVNYYRLGVYYSLECKLCNSKSLCYNDNDEWWRVVSSNKERETF